MKKTFIIWRRFGREHGEDQGFRINPPDVIQGHLRRNVDRARRTAEEDWRWYQVSDDLLVERPLGGAGQSSGTRIYYLPKRNWVILEGASFSSLPDWPWYIHIGRTEWNEELDAWVFTDLFADAIVQADGVTHSVLDLDDLASVTELDLIDAPTLTETLTNTQHLVDDIRRGRFPPDELTDRADILDELNWTPK
jgi:hypothetical protein